MMLNRQENIALSGEGKKQATKRIANLMAASALIQEASGGPYSNIDFRIPNGKPRRGYLMTCNYCGRGGGDLQLFNDGNKKLNGEKVKICKECKKKREEEG